MPLDGEDVKQVTRTLEEIKSTFRAKVDQLEQQAKKFGEDAVTKAEVAKLNDALDNLKKQTTDEINALHRKAARPVIPASEEQRKIEETERKFDLEVASWFKHADAKKGREERMAYKAAMHRLTRFGEKSLTPEETKTLSAGSFPDGGYFIEPARGTDIITRLRETSDMRAIANSITITSNSIKFPVDRDDAGYEWVGEQTSRSVTSSPQVGELEIPVHEISAMPKATQNLLDDAGIDIESWLNEKVANRFARAENTSFVTGNGQSKPAGFLSQVQGTFVTTADATRAFGALQYTYTGSSGAFRTASATVSPADDLLDLIFKFNAGYRKSLTWAMNKTTLGQVRKFKDQLGNFIYNPQLTAQGVIDMVLGYPVQEFADMSDYSTANAFAIALGDFRRGYLVVDRQGIRQLRDPYTSKPYTLFYTTKRVGGAIIDSDAIKVLKFGTS